MGLNRIWTAWCAGAWSIWRNGFGKSSESASAARPWAENCAPWGSAASRPVRNTMRKTPTPWRRSKNFADMVTAIRIQNGWPPVEVWFQDEARVGQKNKITRRWAKRGTRPRAPHDQRTKWAYIFGAICPAEGKGAGLVMPWADTHAMAEHLKLISAEVAPGAHAILIVDQAGWHTSPKLEIPENITLVPLPPRSPELNPVENVWQFIRQNWLSNRVFKSYDDIVALCCESWNKLMDQPWRIRSIGHREWAHRF